ncbi:M15 family metallopeptidase [Trichothermofontia sp.]
MRPYLTVPIQDCGEPLVEIDPMIARITPHPYQRLGAPYDHHSPFYLRQSVHERLLAAQVHLTARQPGWRLQVFDAYRPLAVQQFMVDYTCAQMARAQGLDPCHLTPAQQQAIATQVAQFWVTPNPDPACPPPHSTGAAVDLTLLDAVGNAVAMGSAIDELSPRSYPDYFCDNPEPQAQAWHRSRQLLREVMLAAGFCQHRYEWWHFSYGDQMWAWLTAATDPSQPPIARYGRLVPKHDNPAHR